MDLEQFGEWLRDSKGSASSTATLYASCVRGAVRVLGASGLTTKNLDAYAATMPSNRRSAFRSAWRRFVEFASGQGVALENVSAGRLGPPPRILPWTVRPENFAMAYLAQTIPLDRFGDLRWTDVEFLSPVEAIVRDPPENRRYAVHRRALDVLLSWARSDGQPVGALVPDEPNGRTWMPREALEERIDSANAAATSGVISDPASALLAALPPPRIVLSR